ncbi:MAG: type I methionyl aminopeptidase [Candidatus Schekmanbacteria bacterium]|nr:MAG: type I methionyl aminopeptidase [Candidatus Schekmanbacteria bacterium]
MIVLKTDDELKILEKVNGIVAKILRELEKKIVPGITTRELDKFAEEMIRDEDCIPAFKGYRGYPATLCVSVNEEIVHGIPSDKRLKEGDIVSIDIGAKYKGFYGDAAATFPVGDVSERAMRLIEATKGALEAGIAKAQEGNRLGDVSSAIQNYAESRGFSVVRYFVGHGIGRELHEEPQIPNFGEAGKGVRLKNGMVLAIEPMVNEGSYDVKILNDGWTAVTKDGKLSAHFEHTIAISNGRAKILTK